MVRLEASKTHSLPAGLRQRFIECGGEDKHSALVSVLEGLPTESGSESGARDRYGASDMDMDIDMDLDVERPRLKPTLVFCNTVQSARATEHMLAESGFAVTGYHGDILPERRAANFAQVEFS